MSSLYDEDGIDGPFERGMDAPPRRACRVEGCSRSPRPGRSTRYCVAHADVPRRRKIERAARRTSEVREERRAAGLCITCGEGLDRDGATCSACCQASAVRMQAYREERRGDARHG